MPTPKDSFMRISNRILIPILFTSLLLVKCSCDFFGTAGSFLVSDEDEARLGAQFHQTLLDSSAQYPIFVPKNAEEVEFENYVRGLFQELVAILPQRDIPEAGFTFTIIRDSIHNAFAVPGGYVYLYTGILSGMENESELMGVLGHELAHVTQHHFREQMVKSTAVVLLIQALRGGSESQTAEMAAGAAAALLQLKFSRSNETESDEVGTYYLSQVGRNTLGIAEYFRKAQSAQWFPEFLSTHPSHSNRVEDIRKLVDSKPELKALAEGNLYRDRYLQKTAVVRK